MSLTDIVSALERTGPTQVALVIFALTFAIVIIRTFMPSQRRAHAHAAAIPLNDAPHSSPGAPREERRSDVQA